VPKWLEIDLDNLHTEICSIKHTFYHLSFDLLGSRCLQYGSLEFDFFKTQYYFIACYTLAAQMVELLLLRVM